MQRAPGGSWTSYQLLSGEKRRRDYDKVGSAGSNADISCTDTLVTFQPSQLSTGGSCDQHSHKEMSKGRRRDAHFCARLETMLPGERGELSMFERIERGGAVEHQSTRQQPVKATI